MKSHQSPILNGNQEAKEIIKSLKSKISHLKSKIGLAAILIGKDPASQIYIKIKEKKAKEVGIYFEKHILPASISQEKVLKLIEKLNKSKKIHGILVQLPLPKKFNTEKIINAISDEKDVDGFKSLKHKNIKTLKHLRIIPPTVQAILHLIKISKRKLADKKAVILCNSLEFAEPLKFLLEKDKVKADVLLKPKITHYTLRITHYNLIITALGKKHWLKPEMIKRNAVIIDVGITRNKKSKKIFGDVHPDCFKKSKYISPVPGGVGPLTVAFLLKNTVQLAQTKK